MTTPLTRKELHGRRTKDTRPLRFVRRAGDIFLTLGAIFGVIALVVTALTWLGIVTPLVVTSNSMQPAFSAGDLILARPVDTSTLKTGDIATAPRPDGVLVTHRVLIVDNTTTPTTFTMQGDANNAPDQSPYQVEEVLVPLFIVSDVGWIAAALSNSRFLIVTALALIVLVLVLWTPSKKTK